MVTRLTLTFEVLTPLFMGGADQNKAELRSPSFKGLLRFWYRAVDPEFANIRYEHSSITEETALFGGSGTNAGQSALLLKLLPGKPETIPWDSEKAKSFSVGSGKNAKNGLIYLGFPFQMRNDGRRAISPGQLFKIQCILLNGNEKDRQRITAAMWLLGHLGGGGSRNRRGFGSLALRRWEPEIENEWPEIKKLPLLLESASIQKWAMGFSSALEQFRKWFGKFEAGFHHPHLGPGFKVFPMEDNFAKSEWMSVLNHMGKIFQEYRQRSNPDYTNVKNHLLAANKQQGAFLEYTPERAAFGLPLNFWYSSLSKNFRQKNVGILPFDLDRRMQMERHGSLLFLRPVLARDRLFPVFFRLAGDIPGHTPPGSVQNWSTPLSPWRENAMDGFISWLKTR